MSRIRYRIELYIYPQIYFAFLKKPFIEVASCFEIVCYWCKVALNFDVKLVFISKLVFWAEIFAGNFLYHSIFLYHAYPNWILIDFNMCSSNVMSSVLSPFHRSLSTLNIFCYALSTLFMFWITIKKSSQLRCHMHHHRNCSPVRQDFVTFYFLIYQTWQKLDANWLLLII